MDAQRWPASCASEAFLYLTTTGRRTGRRYRIEIWFAEHGGRLYLLSGGRDGADWVRNIKANERVTVELGNQSCDGVAHIVDADTAEDQLARKLLVSKYADSDDDLEQWGRTSLSVVIDFTQMQA
jgi:deazaflavin-dependent oxidoreductase (nitroreductase family)